MSIFFKKKLIVNLNFENKKIEVKIPQFKPVKYIKTIARIVYKIPNNLKINLLYNDSDLVYYNDEIIGYFFRKNPVSIKVICKNNILNEENKDLHCFYRDPNSIKFYCRDCNMFICEDCKINNLHSSHQLLQINIENLINCVRLYAFTLQSEIFSYQKKMIEKYGNEISEENYFNNLMNENKEIDNLLTEIHKKFIEAEEEIYIYQFENYFTLLFKKDGLINKEKNKINSILKSKYKEKEKQKQIEEKEEIKKEEEKEEIKKEEVKEEIKKEEEKEEIKKEEEKEEIKKEEIKEENNTIIDSNLKDENKEEKKVEENNENGKEINKNDNEGEQLETVNLKFDQE